MSLNVHSIYILKFINYEKTILNLGKTLSRAEQKNVFGGGAVISWYYEQEECSGPEGDFP
ncbi:hypothetical protein BXQ17_10400 [Polaribacter sp. BM10]|nr:hypothetical protein BXQ17_10400 [Polaribacter sp. BM10]